MVGNPALRHHAPPVCYIRIVSEREDAGGWELGGEESSGPWLGRAAGSPGRFSMAVQSVDKDDAAQWLSVNTSSAIT